MNAIKEAKDNIGDYKLKTADDYVVPEDQRVNAEIKLMQLLQLLDQVMVSCSMTCLLQNTAQKSSSIVVMIRHLASALNRGSHPPEILRMLFHSV